MRQQIENTTLIRADELELVLLEKDTQGHLLRTHLMPEHRRNPQLQSYEDGGKTDDDG